MKPRLNRSRLLDSSRAFGPLPILAVQGGALALGTLLMLGGCAKETPDSASSGTGGATSTATSGKGGRGTSTEPGIEIGIGGTTDTSSHQCGDGRLTSDEACDDANTVDGDGCSSNCRTVESGYSCPTAGVACQRVARCGDAVVTVPEPCDDGNLLESDGCSPTCKLELGYKCSGNPSTCTNTVCGDGLIEGAESCDDSNLLPFDGCSSRCQAEPDCTLGACRSRCGDGMVIGEDCDDGNNANSDGCSADCKIEAGFTCAEQSESCEKVDGKCVVRADAIYRDFTGESKTEHPDFIGCSVLPVTLGLVESKLDSAGKPVLSATGPNATACITSTSSFAEWYRKADSNVEVPGLLTLFDNGKGGYVNRYGSHGEPWIDAAGTAYDGSPLFFPIDGQGKQSKDFTPMDSPSGACINGKYGKAPDSYVSASHNFHFTTEVTHWFKYDAATKATLDFTGDDDVWVFLNGILAVDLGGVHHPVDGSVTISEETAAPYGLEDGKVYVIKVFQAERRICGSTFRLTLSGFSTGRSECRPICGDSIVSLGEECDDGKNDSGYNECAPGCKRGEYCGDGIVQQGKEDCDDGNAVDGDACGSACRKLDVIQ